MRILPAALLLALVACDDASIVIDDTGAKDTAGSDTGDTGAVVSGSIQVAPPSIDLGVLFVGKTASEGIVVTNVGEGDVAVTVTVVGGWATAYTFDAYTSAPAPGTSATHTFTLTPTTWGDHSVSILVDDAKSGGHIEVPVLARIQVDADGDGYGSTETGGGDCADDDATINPGATDTWYDFIDSDCAGNDDFDQDGDGHTSADYGGDDCVDTDATAYPGAPDTWYDGVDSDCAGNDDFDQDGDGYVSADYGGDDCLDTDATIHPGATDTWYDGNDTDCAGNDDFDQDGDGHVSADYGGDDCLDTDATVYPGATEVWYDGIDGDCAGDNDYDRDGDGVDYPTDCNDTDPTTTGPTAETINGNDDDCNGLVDDLPVTSLTSAVLYGTAASMYLGDHGLIAMGADVTDDGDTDLIVGAPVSSSGYTWVVDGATAAASTGLVSSYDTAAITGYSSSGYTYLIGWLNGPMEDVDGDGTADVVVGGNLNGYANYSRTYMYSGGSGLSGAVDGSDYDLRVTGDSDSDGSRMIAAGDLDGDGQADIVVGSYYDSYGSWGGSSYCGSVAVLSGSGISESRYDIGDADDRVYGVDDNDYLGYSLVIGDVTDDGYADIITGAHGNDDGTSNGGSVYVIGGNSSLSFDTYADDAADIEVQGDSRDLALGYDTLAHPGDIDGSGALDLGLSSEADGSVWLFLDPSSGVVDAGDADHIISGTAGDLGSMLVIDSDLDGDGADDVVVGSDSDDTVATDAGLAYVFSWSSSWGAALTSADARATVLGTQANGLFGSGGAGGADLDGDGLEDVAIGERSYDATYTDGGAVWIVPGW